MSEKKLQRKIIAWLEEHGFYVVKTIISNKKGTPDILACSPRGRFIAFEVKYGANTPTKLQKYNLAKINKLGGYALSVWDLETVIYHMRQELK